MLLDRALRNTFGNFTTLFLLAGLVMVTTHIVYGIVFRDVLEITELHPFVRGLNPGRRVSDVSAADLQASESARWIVLAVQIVLLPVLVAAARRVIAVERRGGVPTVPDALLHLRDPEARFSFRWGVQEIGTVAGGAALAAGVWYLTQRAGLLAAEPLPDKYNFMALELVRGLALALGAPFFLGAVASAGLARGETSVRSSA